MALDLDQMKADRDELTVWLDERDKKRARQSKAQKALTDAKAFRSSTESILDFIYEDEQTQPEVPTDEYIEWLSGLAKASGADKPSPELAEKRATIEHIVGLAELLDIDPEEVTKFKLTLSRFNAGTPVARTTPGNGGGSGSSERSRHLDKPVRIEWTNANGEPQPPIVAGGRTGEGDWVSARYSMKTKVDAAAEAQGLDPKSVWMGVANQLGSVPRRLIEVDKGELDSVDDVIEVPEVGLTFNIQY